MTCRNTPQVIGGIDRFAMNSWTSLKTDNSRRSSIRSSLQVSQSGLLALRAIACIITMPSRNRSPTNTTPSAHPKAIHFSTGQLLVSAAAAGIFESSFCGPGMSNPTGNSSFSKCQTCGSEPERFSTLVSESTGNSIVGNTSDARGSSNTPAKAIVQMAWRVEAAARLSENDSAEANAKSRVVLTTMLNAKFIGCLPYALCRSALQVESVQRPRAGRRTRPTMSRQRFQQNLRRTFATSERQRNVGLSPD